MRLKLVIFAVLSLFIFSSSIAAAPKMEDKVVDVTEKAAANAWLEIDVAAFEHNIKTVQSKLAPGVKICAVMKADAYGNSIAILMPSIIKLQVPAVGVTSNEELRLVRELGYEGRLTRLRNAAPEEMVAALPYNVEELVGNIEVAQAWDKVAADAKVKLNIHLALNSSGMSRNGLDLSTKQGKDDAMKIAKLPNLKIVGIMTHYPVAKGMLYLRPSKTLMKNPHGLSRTLGLSVRT